MNHLLTPVFLPEFILYAHKYYLYKHKHMYIHLQLYTER